jgi:hypothetical protein
LSGAVLLRDLVKLAVIAFVIMNAVVAMLMCHRNALIYGAKKWVLFPPGNQIMSNKQIFDFYESDLDGYKKRGISAFTCVQTAGEVIDDAGEAVDVFMLLSCCDSYAWQ